ncbi:siderophore-interacting protein [Arthrobacter sp. ISL-72]|uniref:siderophore-interacting protein n=1 Tax=Arthrobacter sp. ISL-72 TaxID=2819114 RepID=UPI001BE65DB2|nr:siderophore-interacting protein [Arthrobacter sp. ISL-72]MBT2596136.1 siderophore-interacting protein [Arthrobacter sp. ISL-72]
MSTPLDAPAYPLRAFDVVTRRVEDVSSHFRRITFSGAALERFGVPGPTKDLRIKLLIPAAGQPLRRFGGPAGQLHHGWYQDWLRTDEPGRGFIRSYTVRAIRTAAQGPEIDIDFVLHSAGEGTSVTDGHSTADGHSGPGSEWAAGAAIGMDAVIIGPDVTAITGATAPGETGIRWEPRGTAHVLLVGDETAVPAISSILETLPANISGHAFLEVPDPEDFQSISTPSSVLITWLARATTDSPRGALLEAAVRSTMVPAGSTTAPVRNTNGRDTNGGDAYGGDTYAWVAAEAATVKALRRYLVDEAGLDPKRSEFRAYWSLGKAGSGANGTPIGLEAKGRQLSRTATAPPD